LGQQITGAGKDSYASTGASLGAVIGGVSPLGPVLGPLVGGALGGLIGGLFGSPKKVEQTAIEKIERNTRETITAINNQTGQLLNLDNRLLNVPSSFVVPGYRPMGVGSGAAGGTAMAAGTTNQTVTIHIHDATDPKAVANAVAKVLQEETRRGGSYVSMR
jgi:hypothetical protein